MGSPLCVLGQSMIAVVLALAFDMMGVMEVGVRFQPDIAKKWLPVNCFFIAMLVTGFLR
jgi:hypothetical protein